MADKEVNIVIKAKDEASSKLKSLGGWLASKFVITLGDVTKATRLLFDAFKDVSKSASESEQANKKLTFALEAQGHGAGFAAAEMQSFNAELQKNTGISDESIANAQAVFIALSGVTGQGLKDATQAAADLSARMGIDLQSAFEMIAKGANGQFAMFQRMGITIKKGANEAENLNNVLAALSEKFGGSAVEDAKTFDGQIKKLGASFDELKERIGGTGNKALAPFLEQITSFINKTNELVDIASGDHLKSLGLSERTIESWKELNRLQKELKRAQEGWGPLARRAEADLDVQVINQRNKFNEQKKQDLELFQLNQKKQQTQAEADKLKADKEKQQEADYLERQKAVMDGVAEYNAALNEDIRIKAENEATIEEGERVASLAANKAMYDAKLKSREEYLTAVSNMEKASNDLIKIATVAHNKELFEIAKAMAIASATVKAYEAFNLALASSPPPFNFIAAGAAVTSGLASVATIASQTVPFADGGSFIVDKPATLPMAGGRTALVGEAGAERIDVTPLNKSGGKTQSIIIHNTIMLDKQVLAKEIRDITNLFNKGLL